jgi:uncharacterized membrane protein YfcA
VWSSEGWVLFPVAVLIAILAMTTGVSGANFWAPVYLLWLRLDPAVGFWLSLVTMLCGFASGLARNLMQGTVNGFLVRQYLKGALPATILGALLAPVVPSRWLFLVFALFVGTYSTRVLCSLVGKQGKGPPSMDERIHWEVALVGGFLTGLITVGLGKLLLPYCLRHPRCRNPAEAVGSTVAVVFVASLCASLARLTPALLQVLYMEYARIANILTFVIPGVLVGGQIGPWAAQRLSLLTLQMLLVGVLYVISVLMFLRFWFAVG